MHKHLYYIHHHHHHRHTNTSTRFIYTRSLNITLSKCYQKRHSSNENSIAHRAKFNCKKYIQICIDSKTSCHTNRVVFDIEQYTDREFIIDTCCLSFYIRLQYRINGDTNKFVLFSNSVLVNIWCNFPKRKKQKKKIEMYTLAYAQLDFNKPAFHAYALWTAVIALKMLYLSMHTAFFRFKNQVSQNILNCFDREKLIYKFFI